MRTHIEIIRDIAQSLASDRTEIPEGISDGIDKIVKLTPKELRHQRRELRKSGTSPGLRRRTTEGSSRRPHAEAVRSVLVAASPTGLKVALRHK